MEVFSSNGKFNCGRPVMAVAIFKLPEGHNTKHDNILNFWLLVSLVTISVVNIRLYLDGLLDHHKHEDLIVTTISGGLIGITILSFLLKKTAKNKTARKLKNLYG